MSSFQIGDKVMIRKDAPDSILYDIGLGNIGKGEGVFTIKKHDIPWPNYNCDGVITEDGIYLPVIILEKATTSPTAQDKLDMLKKYFESGNDVPVQQATIKAKDFWAIYNS